MARRDARVDAYIARARPFARPILKRVRMLAHRADPKIEETLKWGMPAFMHQGIVFGMGAFKSHCTLWFWKARHIFGKSGRLKNGAMGSFGRIESLKDLPGDRELGGYIRQAVGINSGRAAKPARRTVRTRPPRPAGRKKKRR